MKVKEIPHGLTLAAPSEGYIRSPGLHASGLYNELYKALDPKRYDKRDKQGNPTPIDDTKMEMGTSFEEVLEPALAQRLLGNRPGEFIVFHEDDCEHHGEDPPDAEHPCRCGAGIIYSPDYLFDIDGELVLGEFKCSWYSTKNAPHDEKFDKWITQCKLYCYWLNITKVRLYVLFVNGDYKPPSPVLKCWKIEFTQRELRDEYLANIRFARKKGLVPK